MENTIEIRNRKLRFKYKVLDTLVAGVALLGSEVKALRQGSVSLKEAYCYFKHETELVIKNMHIGPYAHAEAHEPLRERRLLLKKNELTRLKAKVEQQKATIVPARLYFSARGWVKIDIALVKGKRMYDKRQDIKARDVDRALQRLRK